MTYASGASISQLDYIMVRLNDRTHVTDVKVIAGEECVSIRKKFSPCVGAEGGDQETVFRGSHPRKGNCSRVSSQYR